jgi:hypothetical protein
MPIDVSQSAILAKLQQRATGAYERIKQTEARPGGRTLPGNLKKAVGQITGAKIAESEKNGSPYIFLYARCVEPLEHHGLSCQQIFGLWDDQYNTFEDNFEELVNNLKLLGYSEQIEGSSENEFFGNVLPWILEDLNERKPYFIFNTSNRAKNDGTFNAFIQGIPAEGYEPPKKLEENEHAGRGYRPVEQQKTASTSATPPKTGATKPGSVKKPGGPPKSPIHFKVGDVLVATIDNQQWKGLCVEVDPSKKICQLTFGDDDRYEVPFADLVLVDTTSVAPRFSVNQFIKTRADFFNDGTSYDGTIIRMNGDKATVRFSSDNSEAEIPLDALIPG